MAGNRLVIKDENGNDDTPETIAGMEVIAVMGVKDGDLQVIVHPSDEFSPDHWGLFLHDMVNHVANAYAQAYGVMPMPFKEMIYEMFDAERKNPTAIPRAVREDN